MRIDAIRVWARWHGTTLCWVLAALSIAMVVARIAFFMPVPPRWIDSYVFINGGQQLLHDPGHIYDPALVQAADNQPTRAFLYPPSALGLFAPFGWLSDRFGVDKAAIAWLTVEVASMLAAFFMWCRACRLPPRWAAPLAAILAVSAPTVSDINSGQVNGVVILLATLAVLNLPKMRSGVWLGAALAIKPALLVLLLVPLMRRRWGMLLMSVLVPVGAAAAMVPFLGMGEVIAYFTIVLPAVSGAAVQEVNNISPVNLITTWIAGRPPFRHNGFGAPPWQLASLATLLVVTFRLVITSLAARFVWINRDPLLVFATLMALVPVVAGTTWLHYILYAYPLVFVVFAKLQRRQALFLTGLAVLLLDPFLNLIFVPDWVTPPDLLALASLLHIESITVALVIGIFWLLLRKSGGGASDVAPSFEGDEMGSDLPCGQSEDHARNDVNDVVLA